MTLISNSEQNFGQWSRRLITMEKIREWDPSQVITAQDTESSCIPTEQQTTTTPNKIQETVPEGAVEDPKRPGHYLFREKVYFLFLLFIKKMH